MLMTMMMWVTMTVGSVGDLNAGLSVVAFTIVDDDDDKGVGDVDDKGNKGNKYNKGNTLP